MQLELMAGHHKGGLAPWSRPHRMQETAFALAVPSMPLVNLPTLCYLPTMSTGQA